MDHPSKVGGTGDDLMYKLNYLHMNSDDSYEHSDDIFEDMQRGT